jgi:hypothetical protein
VLAFVDTPRPSSPRRRAVRGPLLALAGAIALYVALWVIPWRLHPSTGQGALHVYQVGQEGRLEALPEGGPLTTGSKVAFGVSSEREASVVVLALQPRRVLLMSPSTPATGAIERIRPGGPTVLSDRPAIEGPPGVVRFLAVFCKNALPPDTVLKAGQRALAVAQETRTASAPWTSAAARPSPACGWWRRRPNRLRPPCPRRL